MTDGADIAEIHTLMARYNVAGDSGRIEEVIATFTADGLLETPLWRARGAQDLAAALRSGASLGERRPPFVRHNLTSRDIRMIDADSAKGRSYFMVLTDIGLDHAGVYMDRFARADGQWRIAHRQVWVDWKSDQSYFIHQRLGRSLAR